jgi:hypothetical protein
VVIPHDEREDPARVHFPDTLPYLRPDRGLTIRAQWGDGRELEGGDYIFAIMGAKTVRDHKVIVHYQNLDLTPYVTVQCTVAGQLTIEFPPPA